MKKSLFEKTNIKASTIIELLIVMIISGIIIGLTFEGIDIFHKYSRKISNEIMLNDNLLKQYLSLNTIIDKSDSLTFDNKVVFLYRKGLVFGKIYRDNSNLLVNLSNMTDTLPIKIASLNVCLGVLSDTLIVETETITLVFNTIEQVVIPTKKNIYYENN
ncbi:MAG: hypothetical protein IMY73_04545 [Bacteroidetes bacterium]|nr:hypothetical protein [Bacteroidota bacterium]